jgi:AraC family transcriptional regulator, transcriptional activator of pobA
MKKDIPLHLLKDRTASGLQIERFELGDPDEDDAELLGAHRDDHYIFFLLEKGGGSLMIDFQNIHIGSPALYYVLPTQVHHRIKNEQGVGWFLAIDTLLIPPAQREIFENKLWLQQPYILNVNELRQFKQLLYLLSEKYEESGDDTFYAPVVHALLQSFLVMAGMCYLESHSDAKLAGRTVELAAQFKNLLTSQVRQQKSPSAYAAQLNVSESYLNEALKKVTGFPVSYWIQQEVLLEAKRLLYYSQLNVKEIAHLLGYTDHSYFSRFFRKIAGVPALVFRDEYRK